MKGAIVLAVLLVTSLGLAAASPTAEAQGREIALVCHKPGTPKQKTLVLPESAVEAHVTQGDTRGACEPPPGAFRCPVARIVAGPPAQAMLTFQETGPALLYLKVRQATNADVVIPPFSPDTADPVEVTATKTNQAQTATIVIQVTLETESTSTAQFCSTTF